MTTDPPLKEVEQVLTQKRMGEAAQALEVLDNIIHMFQDPYLFYQELIQNALDARPSRIDVQFKLQSSTPYLKEGRACYTFVQWLRHVTGEKIPAYDQLCFDVRGYSPE